MKKTIAVILLFICTLSLSISAVELDIPNPTEYKYINDYSGVVDEDYKREIISIGKELEDKTGAQATIVIINSTDNIDIETYSNKLFRAWGIGQSNKDNGLLILLAIQDRNWRIEVGRGLEGAIPDVLSNKVMTSLAMPSFTEGNYGEGLLKAYSKFSDYIAEEYNVTLEKSLNISLPTNEQSNSNRNLNGGIIGGIFIFLFISDILFNRGRVSRTLLNILFISNFHNRGGGGPSGGGSGGFGNFGGGSSNGGGSSGSW